MFIDPRSLNKPVVANRSVTTKTFLLKRNILALTAPAQANLLVGTGAWPDHFHCTFLSI
jgi:hypothetical protein